MPGQEVVARRQARVRAQSGEHRAHRPLHVVTGRARGLDGGVDAGVALCVEQVAQREQGGGLAGLARCVQHEVLLAPDERQDLVEVEAFERGDAVVLVGLDGAGGVEEAHGSVPRFHRQDTTESADGLVAGCHEHDRCRTLPPRYWSGRQRGAAEAPAIPRSGIAKQPRQRLPTASAVAGCPISAPSTGARAARSLHMRGPRPPPHAPGGSPPGA